MFYTFYWLEVYTEYGGSTLTRRVFQGDMYDSYPLICITVIPC